MQTNPFAYPGNLPTQLMSHDHSRQDLSYISFSIGINLTELCSGDSYIYSAEPGTLAPGQRLLFVVENSDARWDLLAD